MVVDREKRVTELVNAGRPLAEIEHELIDRAVTLDDDERAGLWLYAWSYRETQRRAHQLEDTVRLS